MTYAERIENARNEKRLTHCSAIQIETIKIRQLIEDIKRHRASAQNGDDK